MFAAHIMRALLSLCEHAGDDVDIDDDDDIDSDDDDVGVDRQLVRMGYRFLVRGCKGL